MVASGVELGVGVGVVVVGPVVVDVVVVVRLMPVPDSVMTPDPWVTRGMATGAIATERPAAAAATTASEVIVKFAVVVCSPAEVGANVYVKAQLAPGASVAPAQSWAPPKWVGSAGAPPTTLSVCDELNTLVTVSDMGGAVAPTFVSGKFSAVGVIRNAIPVPVSVMVPEAWPLIEKFVVVVSGPVVVGVNV